MSPPDIIVHVIDDDAAIRDALTLLLEGEGFVARAHAGAADFFRLFPRGGLGCVVSDVRMPGMSGLDLLREVRGQGLNLPVILLTGEADVPMAVEALKGGAADFIEKPFDDVVMLAAVRSALSRYDAADPARDERAEVAERLASLSTRESEVLSGLVDGRSNKSIALHLGISPRTVEVYRANIMTKMRATSLSELVRLTLQAEGAA